MSCIIYLLFAFHMIKLKLLLNILWNFKGTLEKVNVENFKNSNPPPPSPLKKSMLEKNFQTPLPPSEWGLNWLLILTPSLIKDLSQSRIIPQTPIKAAKKDICPNAENQELWGKCHLGKRTKRYCHYCKKRQTRYICAECEVPLCDMPCYDVHLHEMKNKILLI